MDQKRVVSVKTEHMPHADLAAALNPDFQSPNPGLQGRMPTGLLNGNRATADQENVADQTNQQGLDDQDNQASVVTPGSVYEQALDGQMNQEATLEEEHEQAMQNTDNNQKDRGMKPRPRQ